MLKVYRAPAPTTYWDIVEPDFDERFSKMSAILREQAGLDRNRKSALFFSIKARVLGAVATLSELGEDAWCVPVTDETRLAPGFVIDTLRAFESSGLLTLQSQQPERSPNLTVVVYTPTEIGKAVAAPLLAVEQLREAHMASTAAD